MKFVTLLLAVLMASGAFAQSVRKEAVVMIGGIQQYLVIEGDDAAFPLLLFLHGGPGGSMMPYAPRISDELKQHFLVVHWDQRLTGKTRELSTPESTPELARFQEDTREVVDWLLTEYKREKLYLVAHSWGTALGFHIAATYPERIYAYVAIGAMIHQHESERLALTAMLNRAHYTGDEKAASTLASVRIPFENGQDLYKHRKYLAEYSGRSRARSPEYVEQWADQWLAVFNEASATNLFETLPRLQCPVYFMAGRNDLQTNASLMEAYFNFVEAPRKKFYWFEGVGHSLPTSAPARMQSIIIREILPETAGEGFSVTRN